MPQRKTLGSNIGSGGGTGGMMAALGFATSAPPEPLPAPEAEAPPPPPPERRSSPAVPRRAPAAPKGTPASGTLARISTPVSAEALDLARRAAYWHRETLRSFVERAIEAEARRIEKELGLAPLPEAPPPRPGVRR